MNVNQVNSNYPELQLHFVDFVGGAAAVTRNKYGGPDGITVTYVGTGLVDIKWPLGSGAVAADNPGQFCGFAFGFHATVPANVKGYTCEAGDYNAATRTLRVEIMSAAQALVDLAAAQNLSLVIFMKRGAV